MTIKISKEQLKQIIKEELLFLFEKKEIDENWLKKALAGATVAGGLMSAAPAVTEPIQKQTGDKQLVKVKQKEEPKMRLGPFTTKRVALGFLEEYFKHHIRTLKFDELKTLMLAQKALKSGKRIKNNFFYDRAIEEAKKAYWEDYQSFKKWHEIGNPKNFSKF